MAWIFQEIEKVLVVYRFISNFLRFFNPVIPFHLPEEF